MIATFRDAETKVNILERDITFLKTRIQGLETQLADLKNEQDSAVQTSNNSNIVDSIITSDGSSISHRLKHIFQAVEIEELNTDELDVNHIEAGSADITTIETDKIDITATGPQVHISNLDNQNGYYITTFDRTTYMGFGAYYNSATSQWIPVATDVVVIIINFGASMINFNSNTGLTPGVPFAPTFRFAINLAGTVTIPGPVNLNGATTCNGSIDFKSQVYSNGTLGKTGIISGTTANFVNGIWVSGG